jgi:hypothetical protein
METEDNSLDHDPFGNSHWTCVIVLCVAICAIINNAPQIQLWLLDSLPSVLTL